jgi:ATP-binding protein involved in chromosome partitioning
VGDVETSESGGSRVVIRFRSGHGRADRKGIVATLRDHLRTLGLEGDLAIETQDLPDEPPAKQDAKDKPAIRGLSGPGMAPHGGPVEKKTLEGVRHIIAVASGKGGVGKSTVSTNLAVALHRQGLKVGLLDADVYGPSLPTMMNVTARPVVQPETKKILPVMSYGIKCMSMGLLVEPTEAMIWRGPMVMGAVRQFLQDTNWGDTDVLVIDLPPGTGDTQLTLIQAVDLAGAVIVTTPQDVALADAVRGVSMFEKLGVPLLGLVENMAYYELPDGTRDHVFGEGGGARLAERAGMPLLGQVPLQTALCRSADQGLPAALGEGPLAESFLSIAAQVAEALAEKE